MHELKNVINEAAEGEELIKVWGEGRKKSKYLETLPPHLLKIQE